MAQLLLTRSSTFHRAIHTRNEFPLSIRIGKFFLFFSMTLMIGVLSFFYLVKFTEIHTKGYQLRRLELERDKLITEREVQTMGISQAKSLNSVRTSSIAQRMIPAQNPSFIKKDGSFAKLPQYGSP